MILRWHLGRKTKILTNSGLQADAISIYRDAISVEPYFPATLLAAPGSILKINRNIAEATGEIK